MQRHTAPPFLRTHPYTSVPIRTNCAARRSTANRRCHAEFECQKLPQGKAAHTAPQIKTQYSQYSQYSQSAPPAEYSKTLRLCRILAQNYRRVVQSSLIAAGVCVLRGRGTIETDGYGNERKRTEKWCATGYSVGLRCRCLVWLGRKCAAG